MRMSRRALILAVPMSGLARLSQPRNRAIRIVERRTYSPHSLLPSRELLLRIGMKGLAIRRTSLGVEYELRFDSLAARARAWDSFNTDPQWCALREQRSIELLGISISES